MVSIETEHVEFRAQVWGYWKGASVAVSLTPVNYCNWQVWEVWEVWIRPSRPLHDFLMKHQLTSPSPEYITFGYGQHSWCVNLPACGATNWTGD